MIKELKLLFSALMKSKLHLLVSQHTNELTCGSRTKFNLEEIKFLHIYLSIIITLQLEQNQLTNDYIF